MKIRSDRNGDDMFWIIQQRDSSSEACEQKILVSSLKDLELMDSLIKEFEEKDRNYGVNMFQDFVDFMNKKGIDGKIVDAKTVTISWYDSS